MSEKEEKRVEEVVDETTSAPAPNGQDLKENGVKVPVEVDDDQMGAEAELDEEALVEAAKRAGTQAAEEEIAVKEAERAKAAEAAHSELQDKLDGAQDEIDAAKKEAADATERLLRLQADWDNFRRRTAQERLNERDRAGEKLVVSLLPVLDDMERAIEHAAKAAQEDAEDNQFDQFVAGVQAVHDKMVSILGKAGVEVINPLGDAFNPLEHQAVGRVEDTEAYDESVSAVYLRGYRMGGKVIREAMVQVTFGGPKRPDSAKEDNAATDVDVDAAESREA